MDLNSIELTPELITSFYKSHLVDIPDEKSAFHPSVTVDFNHLGENGKNILIVVPHVSEKILAKDQLDFLNNLLIACKLDMRDIAVVPNDNTRPIKEKLEYFKSRIVILFGIDPVSIGLPIGFPQFQVQPFNNVTYLYSPSLDELINDKLMKSKLWICLKRIFNL